MFNGVHENRLSTNRKDVIVRCFPGAKIGDIRNRLKPLLDDLKPETIILHLGTNNAPLMTSNGIVDELLKLKSDILKIRASCKVIFSTPTIRTDDGKASLTIFRVNKHLGELKVDTIDNTNISSKDLGKKGLHLSKSGKSKLAKNVRKKLNGEL